jgi:hypothetical protein
LLIALRVLIIALRVGSSTMWSTCTTPHRQRTGFRSAAQPEAAAVLVLSAAPPPPQAATCGLKHFLSSVACRPLHVVCRPLHAVCRLLHVACCVSHRCVFLSTAHAGLLQTLWVATHSGTHGRTNCYVLRTQEVFDVLVEFEHSKNESYLFENCTNLRRSIAPTFRPKSWRQPTRPLP